MICDSINDRTSVTSRESSPASTIDSNYCRISSPVFQRGDRGQAFTQVRLFGPSVDSPQCTRETRISSIISPQQKPKCPPRGAKNDSSGKQIIYITYQ